MTRGYLALLACLGLAACSTHVPDTQDVSAAPESAIGDTAAAVPTDGAPEIDISDYPESSTECRREMVVGTRITRERCYAVSGAEKVLLDHQIEYEIEYSREQAMRTELERMDRASNSANEQMR